MNTKFYTIASLFLAVIFLSSCAQQAYQSPTYEEKAETHKKIAVLPYELVYDGRIPAKLTQEELDKLVDNESLMFQASLYNQIVHKARRPKRQLQIELQHFNDTNARLKKAGISIKDSWTIPSAELAEILNVDAVVKSKVHKRLFLTNTESAAVAVGASILGSLAGSNPVSNTARSMNKTSDIYVSCSIVDAEDEVIIWSYGRDCSTSFRTQPEQAVNEINSVISRRFPYRNS